MTRDPNKDLIQALEQIEKAIASLQPGDRDSLVDAGVALEEAMSQIPESRPRVSEVLVLAVEGLQALYNHLVADPPGTARALASAVGVASRLLSADGDADAEALIDGVREAIQRASQEEPAAAPASEPTPLTVDDVAALLVQSEPDDRDSLNRLHAALRDLASGADAPMGATDALAAMESISAGASEDVGAALAQIGDLLASGGTGGDDAGDDGADEDDTETPTLVGESGVSQLPADADRDLLAEYIVESRENIDSAEAALLTLEMDSTDQEAVNTVFRAFHTIKGTSAFLGLDTTTKLAHGAESLLSQARDGEIKLSGGYADLALRSIDALKELMQRVEDALGGEPLEEPPGLRELMKVLADPGAAGISDAMSELEERVPRVGDILVASGTVSRNDVERVAIDQGPRPIGEALVRSKSASVEEVGKALRTQRQVAGADSAAEATVRVRTDRLDRLIDMVGELVIAHSMVAQDDEVVLDDSHELSKKVARTGKIVRELQDLSMSMRMVPLKATFRKMARLVRDLAHKNGKAIEFRTEGDDTEIDRNMVAVVNDPLVHMIRNAVDHGIELPEVREEAGKSRTGLITLSAYRSGGSIVVELRDDGQGLDREAIVEKAISRGLIGSDKGMSENEVFNLVFEPGFSTAEQVTDVSGRGVGMDVVKKSVEALRGRIDISSERGKGATFSLRLPLTLAVTDGMLVSVGEERYIVPTLNIEITFRPDANALSTIAGRGEMVLFRGDLMPILRLHELFDVPDAVEDPTQAMLLVLSDGDRRYALLADDLLGQQQVVAKSLGEALGRVLGIAGAAILGDGRVGLLLDPPGIPDVGRRAARAMAGAA